MLRRACPALLRRLRRAAGRGRTTPLPTARVSRSACAGVSAIASAAALAWGSLSASGDPPAVTTNDEEEEALRAATADLPEVTAAEVWRHCTPDDAWVIINGIAYDVTSLLANHPGGSGILAAHAGRDVSRQFAHLSHSARARRMLPGLAVGRLPAGYEPPPLPSLDALPAPAPGAKRILVVGAGVCGAAAAALLAERGHAVMVVDEAPLVGGTALRSTAILFIGPAVEKLGRARGESLTDWSGNTSYAMMEALSQGPAGRDVGWEERGALGVISDPAVLAFVAKRYELGGPLHGKGGELVSAERLRELEPSLSPALLGATWHAKGATVDPYLVCDAYAARARAAGARFALGRRVTALARRPGGGFTAVVERAADPTAPAGAPARRAPVALDADELVLAAGWLCRPLAAQLGHDVPVSGTHGQLFTTQSAAVGRLRHNLYSWEGPAYWNAHPEAQSATLRPRPPHERMTRHFYAVQVGVVGRGRGASSGARGVVRARRDPLRCCPAPHYRQAGNGVLKIGGDRIRLPDGSPEEGLPLLEVRRALCVPPRSSARESAAPHIMQAGIADTVENARAILPGLEGCEVTGAWSGTMPSTPGQTPFLGRLEDGLCVTGGGHPWSDSDSDCGGLSPLASAQYG